MGIRSLVAAMLAGLVLAGCAPTIQVTVDHGASVGDVTVVLDRETTVNPSATVAR